MKTRLTKKTRTLLKNLAESKIVSPETAALLNTATAAYTTLGLKLHAQQFPEKDLKVLGKYGLSQDTNEIFVVFTANAENELVEYSSMVLQTPVLHVKYRGFSSAFDHRVEAPLDSKFHKLAVEVKKLKSLHEETLRKIQQDYSILIDESKTFEDVVEVWSEAETLRLEICTTALSVVTADVVRRIKKDTKSRAKAKT